jgi:glucose/arabinose dehydrogenase
VNGATILKSIPACAIAAWLLAAYSCITVAQQSESENGTVAAHGNARDLFFAGPRSRLVPREVPTGPVDLETVFIPKVRVVPLVRGLKSPWSLAFLPSGEILVTEREGRLRIVRHDVLDPEPISGTPEVFAAGQGGLLDIALDPSFSSNRLIYLSYVKGKSSLSTVAIARGRLDGKKLVGLTDIFVADAWNHSVVNY